MREGLKLLSLTQRPFTPDDEDSESYQYNTKKVFTPTHHQWRTNLLIHNPTCTKEISQSNICHLLLKYKYKSTRNNNKWEKTNDNTNRSSSQSTSSTSSTKHHLWLEINIYTCRSVSLSAAKGIAVILVLSTVFLWEE